MKSIKNNEVPYSELEQIGLSREVFWSLPKGLLTKVLNEGLSPMMNLHIEGTSVLGKISFRREEEKVTLMIYPRMKNPHSTLRLTKREMSRLQNDGIIRKKIAGIVSFMQLDKEINTVVSVPIKCVYIPNRIGDIEITNKELKKLRDGDIVEKDGLLMGIDLLFDKGFRTAKGEGHSWRKENDVDYEAVNIDELGYWCLVDNHWKYVDNTMANGLKR